MIDKVDNIIEKLRKEMIDDLNRATTWGGQYEVVMNKATLVNELELDVEERGYLNDDTYIIISQNSNGKYSYDTIDTMIGIGCVDDIIEDTLNSLSNDLESGVEDMNEEETKIAERTINHFANVLRDKLKDEVGA